MKNSEVIERIEKAAWLANVSINALLIESGVAWSTFWRWKTDKVIPDAETIDKIIKTAEILQRNNRFFKA